MKLIQDNSNWDKEVSVKLSLKELQMLYDSVAVTSYSDCYEHWLSHCKNVAIPYLSEDYYNLFGNIESILKGLGGSVEDV